MTKSDLEQLTLLNSEISRDLERLQELYALLTGCTSSISGTSYRFAARQRPHRQVCIHD